MTNAFAERRKRHMSRLGGAKPPTPRAVVTVLHTLNGINIEVATTALTAYMLGSTTGVLFGGWFADTFKHHCPAVRDRADHRVRSTDRGD
jgi:hypothetical protein